jgi:hypothetical protein
MIGGRVRPNGEVLRKGKARYQFAGGLTFDTQPILLISTITVFLNCTPH